MKINKFNSGLLNNIIFHEIENGNNIVEESQWLPKCKKIIILKKKFTTNLDVKDGLIFNIINDPHYWYADYYDPLTKESLACKFN